MCDQTVLIVNFSKRTDACVLSTLLRTGQKNHYSTYWPSHSLSQIILRQTYNYTKLTSSFSFLSFSMVAFSDLNRSISVSNRHSFLLSSSFMTLVAEDPAASDPLPLSPPALDVGEGVLSTCGDGT